VNVASTQHLKTPPSVKEALVRELLAGQNADGGWGASPGAVSNTECTALARLALSTTGADPEGPVRWLLSRQDQSGAWPYQTAGPAVPWPTPIALLAVRGASGKDPAAAVDRGFAWLLEQRSKPLPWRIRLGQWLTGTKVVEHDTTLHGWSWAPGTAAWVEPTAWALMALKAHWPGEAPRAIRGRVREGEAMILDRECPSGGWNYGNKRALDQDLAPYPDTTALALLALRGRSPAEVERGFGALNRLLDEQASGLALALGTLCRRAWGRDAAALEARLAARYESGGFSGESRTLALAVLALAPTTHWLGKPSHG
jgi:hypothetical protein